MPASTHRRGGREEEKTLLTRGEPSGVPSVSNESQRKGGDDKAGYRRDALGDIDYRLVFEMSAECMLIITLDGDVLDANLEARKVLRRRREDLVAEGCVGMFDPNDHRVKPALTELKRLGGFRGELRLVCRGGDPLAVEVSIAPLGKDTPLAIVSFKDLAELQRAERESEERFRITFDQAAVGIAHVDPSGKWLRANKKLCEIVGYGREELLQKTFQDITHPEDLDADLDQVLRVLGGEIGSYSMEKRYLRKDGSVVWIDLTVSLVRDASGDPSYFIAVVNDIDERKGAEQRREHLLRSISPREAEVLKLLVRGLTNKEIARSMGFGMSTAKTHVQRVIMKLGAQSRSRAAAHAVELGLIEPEL